MTLKSFSDSTTTEARQFLLDRRNERSHPKRHRTLGRRKRLAAQKKRAVKERLAVIAKDRDRYLTAAKAYWAGEADGHP